MNDRAHMNKYYLELCEYLRSLKSRPVPKDGSLESKRTLCFELFQLCLLGIKPFGELKRASHSIDSFIALIEFSDGKTYSVEIKEFIAPSVDIQSD